MHRANLEKKLFKEMIAEMINKWIDSDGAGIQKELRRRVKLYEDAQSDTKGTPSEKDHNTGKTRLPKPRL